VGDLRDESGFSLLEITISIAVLVLLSGFIIQMFVTSIHLNRRAYNLDMGVNAAIRAIETLKGEPMIEGVTIAHYYDSNWNLVSIEAELSEAHTEKVKFVLIVDAEEDESYEYEVFTDFDLSGNYVVCSGGAKLYKLAAAVYEVKPNEEHEVIVSFNTCKYQQLR